MNTGIFLEAEMFDNPGGWTIDTQCQEAMGSCYLMAHGTGVPVRDALTEITIPARARWHIYARTRDWTAVWKRGTPAGRFQITVDGVPLPRELGTNGMEWGWQKAGEQELSAGTHCLALHDLTGFDGRCDAVYLTMDADDIPPDDKEKLNQLRRKNITVSEDPEEYDLLICGGGYAGICAALSAKSKHLKFKLIQNRPMLGGCGSSEIRVWTGGMVNLPPYPELGNIAAAISPIQGYAGLQKDPELFEDSRKRILFSPDELLLNEMVIGVEMNPENPGEIAAIITKSVRTGEETRRKSKLFADCTGDAVLARFSGCAVMYGCEGRTEFGESLAPEQADRMVMGHSVLWETRCGSRKISFPDIDWGIEITEENVLERLSCCWDWETGQYRDQVMDIEYIRDYGLMTCYANWSFLKNRSPQKKKWENMDLEWISAIGGKRESYRVCGDLILTQNDIEQKIPYDDATGSITWSIDLHFPDPENRRIFGEAFQSCAYHRGIGQPYPVPYRCLYARDAENLFLGGRCLSLSHVAFSCVRVMRTLGMLGEVIGMAAELCIRHRCSPRMVYSSYLEELKDAMRQGIPMKPPFGWLPGKEESYHFMRPAGTFGNRSEDCWYRFHPDGSAADEIPDEIGTCLETLDLIHRNGKKFREKS